MDIKWKEIKLRINFKIVMLAAAIILTVVFVVNGIIALDGIPYYYKPEITGICFTALATALIVWDKIIVDKLCSYINADNVKLYRRISLNAMLISIAVYLVYALIATIILNMRQYDNGWLYRYKESLILYHMSWIIYCLYLIPLLCIPCAFSIMMMQKYTHRALEISAESSYRSESMKIDLLTNVAHDLKTPLTSIIGYLALMDKEELSPVMKDYVTAAANKSEVLKTMIEKVFDLSKASSGNANIKLETLSLNMLVEQVMADINDGGEPKKVFKLELAEGDTNFCADNVYAYRIVQNLITNAVKYSLDGTRIFVRTYTDSANVYFEIINVSNYPLDIDTDVIKERFVRGDKSRSTEGNGLGLAIVETYTTVLKGRFNIYVAGDTFKAVVDFPIIIE